MIDYSTRYLMGFCTYSKMAQFGYGLLQKQGHLYTISLLLLKIYVHADVTEIAESNLFIDIHCILKWNVSYIVDYFTWALLNGQFYIL